MIRTIFFWTVFLLVFLVFNLLARLLALIFDAKEVYYRTSVIISRVLLWTGGIRVDASGMENVPREGTLIFAANHQSAIDGCAVLPFLGRRVFLGAMHQVYQLPLLNGYLKRAGYLLLDLRNPKQLIITMRKILGVLRSGECFLIFPEGTRSPDNRLLEFRDGVSMLVLQSGLPVVPVALTDAYKIMQRDELYGLKVNSGRIKVRIGKPITFHEFKEANLENAKAVSVKLREAIARLMQEGLQPGL